MLLSKETEGTKVSQMFFQLRHVVLIEEILNYQLSKAELCLLLSSQQYVQHVPKKGSTVKQTLSQSHSTTFNLTGFH